MFNGASSGRSGALAATASAACPASSPIICSASSSIRRDERAQACVRSVLPALARTGHVHLDRHSRTPATTRGSTEAHGWTRPGRMVSAVVCTSPTAAAAFGCRATTVPYSPLNWRQTEARCDPTGRNGARCLAGGQRHDAASRDRDRPIARRGSAWTDRQAPGIDPEQDRSPPGAPGRPTGRQARQG